MGCEGHIKVMSGGFQSAFLCTAQQKHFKMTLIVRVISDMLKLSLIFKLIKKQKHFIHWKVTCA